MVSSLTLIYPKLICCKDKYSGLIADLIQKFVFQPTNDIFTIESYDIVPSSALTQQHNTDVGNICVDHNEIISDSSQCIQITLIDAVSTGIR